MRHNYLLEHGRWLADGTFTDEEGVVMAISGENRITHEPGRWLIQGYMQPEHTPSARIENRYEVAPFAAGSDETTWRSDNPALGPLLGNYVIMDEYIISDYQTEDGLYHGSEMLQRQDLDTYKAVGALFHENKRVSSWLVTLRRQED